MSNEHYQDILLGFFYGCVLGDALGMPYEFAYGRKPYVYSLEEGNVSDDTEMMMALFTTIIEQNGWNRDKVIEAYCRWTGSGCVDVGINTRQLL